VSNLGAIASDYPHESVRHNAADFSRVLIARQLQRSSFSSDQAARLLEHLVRLAPHDRLLSRDTNRYLADRRSAELGVRRVVPPPLPGNKPTVVRRFDLLGRQIQWLRLRCEGHWFFALGVTPQLLMLLRGVWEGQFQSLAWECPAAAVRQGFVFEPTAQQGRAVALARSDGPPLLLQRFPASDLFHNRECVAGTPSWLPTQGFPFAIGENVVWSVHLASGRAILSCYDTTHGRLQRTLDITDDLLADATRTPDTRLSLTAVENTVAVALGNRLILTQGDGTIMRVELPGQSVHVFGTMPHTRRGVAVMLSEGAVMCWAGTEGCVELDRDIKSPLGTFVPGGPLVLISGTQLLLLDLDSRGVHGVVRMDTTGSPLVGVCAAANPGEFAVLDERGIMTVYRSNR
jgi:hypothetical protein